VIRPSKPDYVGLALLLLEPLLEDPSQLLIDREVTCQGKRVWLRVQFSAKDKGRVLGRGGRTLQAIRQVLDAAASLAGQQLYLDVYDLRG
jgi:predicted RNA-binding protein YlqC (UPF0109 family)